MKSLYINNLVVGLMYEYKTTGRDNAVHFTLKIIIHVVKCSLWKNLLKPSLKYVFVSIEANFITTSYLKFIIQG